MGTERTEEGVGVEPTEVEPVDRGIEGSSVSAAETQTGVESGAVTTTEQPAVGTAAPAADPSWTGVREAVGRLGYKLDPGITDDTAALAYLVRQAQEANRNDYYSQIGRQLAPHAPQIQEYMRQQQAPPEPSEWDRPPFDEKWLAVLDRDQATGVLVAKTAGVPPAIVEAANKYLQWYERKDRDPEGYYAHLAMRQMQPLMQRLDAIEQRWQQGQSRSEVDGILRQNADWLYARDEQGNVQVNPMTRQAALSPAGIRYAQLVAEAKQMGVANMRHQDTYARRVLAAEVTQAGFAQSQQQQDQSANPQTRQATTAPSRNQLGSLPAQERGLRPGAAEPVVGPSSLKEMLEREFAAAGIRDEDVDMFPG